MPLRRYGRRRRQRPCRARYEHAPAYDIICNNSTGRPERRVRPAAVLNQLRENRPYATEATITRPRTAASVAASFRFAAERSAGASHCRGGVGVVMQGLLQEPCQRRLRGRNPSARTGRSTAGEPVSPSVTRSRASDASRAGLRARGWSVAFRRMGRPPGASPAAAHGSLQPPTVAGAAPALLGLHRPAHRLPVSSAPPESRGADTRSRNRAIQENVPHIVNRRPPPGCTSDF